MPTYEYECSQCGVFEEYQDMTDELLTKCPTCGGGVQRLLGAGAAVIVKGGHLSRLSAATDLLFDGRDFAELPAQRIVTRNTHGTGCSFSAALATELARGRPLLDAVRRSKRFITEAIRHSLDLGHGCGPTNPLAALCAVQENDE